MKWEPAFSKIEIRGFNPTTSRKNKIERKKILRDKIKAEIGKNLIKVQNRCKYKPLFIDSCFYLLHADDIGRSKKDLDNLMKILLDALSVNMVHGQNPIKGLGLVIDDSHIYKIKSEKQLVNSPEREGMDLQISIGH